MDQLGLALEGVEVLTKHPAKWSDPLLTHIERLLADNVPRGGIVLDPFGGTGKLGRISGGRWRVVSCDLEREWLTQGRRNDCSGLVLCDATAAPFASGSIDAIVTSPAYGNRMADSYLPDGSKPSDATRNTYPIALGRDLHPGSGAGLHWGDEYRAMHAKCVKEWARVLKRGGLLVVNMKDHVRDGKMQYVSMWWDSEVSLCGDQAFTVERSIEVPLKGDQNTARARAAGRPVVDVEDLMVFKRR